MLPHLLSSGIVVSKCGQRSANQEWSSFFAGLFAKLGIGIESQRIPWVDGLWLGRQSNFRQIGMSPSAGALCVLGLRGKRPNQYNTSHWQRLGGLRKYFPFLLPI